MASKRWQSEWAARLSRNVSRREETPPAPSVELASPPPPARAPGGVAAYARGKSRQTDADRRAIAALVGVIKIAKTLE